jgi:Holliday junction DNA helicase RuvA
MERGDVAIDVGGVGYRVTVPSGMIDSLKDGETVTLWVTTYVREDRFSLFGFLDEGTRRLFETLIDKPGIGPKMALDLCGVPRAILLQAVTSQDAKILTAIKGIGGKTAEKLLVELKAILERSPELLSSGGTEGSTDEPLVPGDIDRDTIAALRSLGYSTPMILDVLRRLPKDLTSTEQRVTAALRQL